MSSNISQVINRLKGARAKIPVEINDGLKAERWVAAFMSVAESAMQGAAVSDEERAAIPELLARIKASGALHVEMSAISLENLALEDPNNPFPTPARKELIEWVKNHKDLDPKMDYFKRGEKAGQPYPAEWIASRVMHAILENPDDWIESENPTGLKAFLGLTKLSADGVSRLLMAVSHVWLEFARQTFPIVTKNRLRGAFK